jgi:four helix bundle protein
MPGATHFTELIVWQLADGLRRATFELTAREAFRRDLKLHAQTEDSINSACRNIAEGFGCETHREFARFLRIARRSLNELQDAFCAAREKGYVSDADLHVPRRWLRRIFPALGRFIGYLDRTPTQRNRLRDAGPPERRTSGDDTPPG